MVAMVLMRDDLPEPCGPTMKMLKEFDAGLPEEADELTMEEAELEAAERMRNRAMLSRTIEGAQLAAGDGGAAPWEGPE